VTFSPRVEACRPSTTTLLPERFLAKPAKLCHNKYRRFATAAEALRFAVEDLRTPKAFGAWLDVGDERFNSIEIRRLYEAADYHPLRKST
jgi:hypothetical protein